MMYYQCLVMKFYVVLSWTMMVLVSKTQVSSWDSTHLLHDIWPNQFGAAWTDGLAMVVCNLIYANSQDDFDSTLSESNNNFVERR